MKEGDLIPVQYLTEIPAGTKKALEKRLIKLQKHYLDEDICAADFAWKALNLASDIIKALELKEKSVCKAGCHYCCIDVPVAVSYGEARLIARRAKLPTKNPNRKNTDFNFEKSGACRFLKDGKCSIYEVRPLACRAFFSVDSVQHCIDDIQHQTFTVESNEALLEINAMMLINEKRKKTGKAMFGELEEWF